MLMALVIVGLILSLIIHTKKSKSVNNKLFKNLIIFSITLTLIQVVLGTQVREFVDEKVKLIISQSILVGSLSNAELIDFCQIANKKYRSGAPIISD